MEMFEKKLGQLKPRPYQNLAIRSLSDFVKNLVRGKIERKDLGIFQGATLVEMATGSGKTFTTGRYLEHIIKLRDRYNRLFQKDAFQALNIVILTNRIDGLEQFRDDLIHGRTAENSKPPIISRGVLSNIRSQTFHSQADNLESFNSSDLDDIEGSEDSRSDNLYFSTYQTASIKDLASRLRHIDIILIDEAHNAGKGTDDGFYRLIESLSEKGRYGKAPHIIAITATPNNITKEIFGESVFEFGLAEYLASPYSPRVEYKLITATIANQDEIRELSQRIDIIKKIADVPEKRRALREIEEDFDAIMARYPDTDSLVSDLIGRIQEVGMDGAICSTIVFVSSISEADTVARILNSKLGKDTALAYHSRNKGNNALARLANPVDSIKFIIAVDMLNESIDLPTVENVVFWRGTDVAKIYLQQFGRGLRGDGTVTYYDYVGGMQNFAWIGSIHNDYVHIKKGQDNREQILGRQSSSSLGGIGVGGLTHKSEGFNISVNNFGVDIHDVCIGSLGFKIQEVRDNTEELSQEDMKRHFIENGTLEKWRGMKQKDRELLIVNGHKLKRIAKTFGVQGDPIDYNSVWYELLEKIFGANIEKGEGNRLKRMEITQEDVRNYFKENGSIERWKLLTNREKEQLKIQGNGLRKVAKLFLMEGNPVGYTIVWYELLERIFGVTLELDKSEKTEITQENIKEYFRENGTPEAWKNMKSRERYRFTLKGHKLNRIARLFGIDGDPLNNSNTWYNLVEKIFTV